MLALAGVRQDTLLDYERKLSSLNFETSERGRCTLVTVPTRKDPARTTAPLQLRVPGTSFGLP